VIQSVIAEHDERLSIHKAEINRLRGKLSSCESQMANLQKLQAIQIPAADAGE
jgi:hypothetical protein